MKIFFKSIPNRIKAVYVLWFGLHFSLYVLSGNFFKFYDFPQLYFDDDFYPFFDVWGIFDLNTYDHTEFLIYTTVPLFLYFAIMLWKKESDANK